MSDAKDRDDLVSNYHNPKLVSAILEKIKETKLKLSSGSVTAL